MSSIVKTIEALLAAGATGDQILAVVKVLEAERDQKLIERREKDAARKRRSREMSAGVRVTSRTPADTTGHPRTSADGPEGAAPACTRYAQVVNPSSSLRSEEVGGGGEAREAPADDWPTGKPTDLTRTLIEAVSSPWLDPSKSHGLVTTAGRLAAWKREGASWEHDVVPVVGSLCSKQRGPIATWKFFDQAIARSIADNRAALEIPPSRAPANDRTRPSADAKLAARHDNYARAWTGSERAAGRDWEP